MNPIWTAVLSVLAVSSLAGFFLMGLDKWKATRGDRRIPEKVLFEVSLVGGFIGVLLAGSLFRHKTSKRSFMAVIVLTTVVWAVVLLELVRFQGLP